MRKLLFSMILMSLTLLGAGNSAIAAETDTVAGIWRCNFLPGKDMENLTTWRDFYVAQLEELDSEDAQSVTAFMWTPRFSGAEVDLVWFEYHEKFQFWNTVHKAGQGPSGEFPCGSLRTRLVMS